MARISCSPILFSLAVLTLPAAPDLAWAQSAVSTPVASPPQAASTEPPTVGSTGVIDPTAPGSAQDPTLQSPRPSVRAPTYVNSRGETGVDVSRDTARRPAGTVPVDRPNPNSQAIDR